MPGRSEDLQERPHRNCAEEAGPGNADGLDTSAWTEDEKGAFNQTLMDLQETIQALLNPSAPSNLA